MRRGGGKGKGSAFERKVAVALSLWVTNGQNSDVFWRAAMSGGRATVHHARGGKIRQVGDICAVSHEGHAFCDKFFIECKHVKKLSLRTFLFANRGPLAAFWRKAIKQARDHDRSPMLIARENNGPTLVLTSPGAISSSWTLATARVPKADISLFVSLVGIKYTRIFPGG